MGKGDHPRAWAHQLPLSKYADRVDAIDWKDESPEPRWVRLCIECKGLKPSGKWCAACDRDTASERIDLNDVPVDFDGAKGITSLP